MIYPCEFDGLKVEAAAFQKRLEEEIGKTVRWREVGGVPHGWDKSPNPFRTPLKVDEYYKDACDALRVAFGMTLGAADGKADLKGGDGKTGDAGIRRHEVDETGFNEDEGTSHDEVQSEVAKGLEGAYE